MILRAIHWIEGHVPMFKALFLMAWLLIAVACGISTGILIIVGHNRGVPAGIISTFAAVCFFLFFRALFVVIAD